ncbi:MAG: hypothetical protein ACI9VI_001677 [Candidatus Azotimanducaceae bacterium]|jgi:hypothetical protein
MNTSWAKQSIQRCIFLIIFSINCSLVSAQDIPGLGYDPKSTESLLYQPVLGPVVIDSKIGEPFRAHIEFILPIDVGIDDISVRIASELESGEIDIEHIDFVSGLNIGVSSNQEGHVIELDSENTFLESYLEFALMVSWLEQEELIANAVYIPLVSDSEHSQELSAEPKSALPKPTRQRVPAGFETLSEPQITEIDVMYGGNYLISTLARFTFEELTFLDPSSIVERLPNLIDPTEIALLLQRPLPTNAPLMCRSDFQVDCGSLTPIDVGAIFNRNEFSAQLFIAAELLETTSATESRFLPDSSAGFSAYNESSLTFSGSDEEQATFNFNNITQIGLAENRLLLRSNWTDSEGILIDEAGLIRDYRGKNYQLGVIRANSNNLSFMNTEQFIGLSIESSLITRTDLGQSQGTEISLFFSSRSLVEVYRDNRLLYTGYYDVGNRTLVTSTLPSGSYNIEIRITDVNGATTSEERFYSKSARLSPINETLFFFQAGSLIVPGSSSFSPSSENQIFRAGLSKRLFPNVNGSIGFSRNALTDLVEASLFRQGERLSISSGLAYESNGALGFDLDLNYRWESFTASLETRKILNDSELLTNTDEDISYQLDNSLTQYSARLNYRSKYGNFGFFYRQNEREAALPLSISTTIPDFEVQTESTNRNNIGVRWDYSGIRIGGGRMRLGFEFSKNNENTLGVFSLSYNFRGNGRNYSISPRYTREVETDGASSSGLKGSANANFSYGEQERHQLNIRADKQENNSIEASYRTTAFNTASNIVTRYNMNTGKTFYNGQLRTGFATTGNARAFGGNQSGESAFLINVEGISEDSSDYEVLIDGSPKGVTQAGRTMLVPVAPYNTYKVDVRSRGNQLVNLQRTNYIKTVYPGNVVALDWVAEIVKVAYGRIVGQDGLPLANARISSPGTVSVTNDQGYFQIEISNKVESLSIRQGIELCEVNFKQDDSQELVMNLGILVCD